MADTSENPDRAILRDQDSGWTGDPERSLTEEELDGLVDRFGAFDKAREKELRSALRRLFRSLVGMAIHERHRETKDGLEGASKPSTIVAREMVQVQKACEKLDVQLAKLDPATRTWLNRHLKNIGVRDRNGDPVRLKNLLDLIGWPLDHLIHAAHSAEGMSRRGTNNAALRYMVEGLANWWEEVHGRAPVTDKGRGLREDPFLELCRDMAGIARKRLRAKGGEIGTNSLAGIVGDVVKKRSSATGDPSQEK